MNARPLLPVAGLIAGYAVFILANPVRASLHDGSRCLERYKQIWILPALFAFGHAVFRLWVRWFEASLPGNPPFLTPWSGWRLPEWPAAAAASWLPATENLAGLFNCLVDTFPLSVLAAAAFLCNWGGYQAALFRALRRRLGWAGSLAVHAGLVTCAAADIVKPLLFGGLLRLNFYLGADALEQIGEIVNWLGFIFEYLLSVGLQIYLILLCFVWLRGLRFDFDELRRFALRRFSFVVKWPGVILILSTLGISVPTIVSSFRPLSDPEGSARLIGTLTFSRWVLAIVILAACSVQITLIFHNESLRKAMADHARLLRRHGLRVGWFAVTALLHLFLLALLNATLLHGFPEGTWPALGWSLLYPVVWAALAAWLLASWVALFRRCEPGHAESELV